MSLSPKQSEMIESHLINKIRKKLENYNPETNAMPFHYRLLGKNRMALFSFIHSINTMLGQSIFEHLGEIVAKSNAIEAISQYKKFDGYVSDFAEKKINEIMRELKAASRKPDKIQETEELLKLAKRGKLREKINKRIDLFVKSKDGTEYYYELKTAKPNVDVFKTVKKQLLEWIVMRGSQDSNIKIKTIVAIPYNPYEPNDYERWTLRGLFDLEQEVLVGKEFWDFLGGSNTYEDLLDVFKQVGLKLNNEIDDKMGKLGEA